MSRRARKFLPLLLAAGALLGCDLSERALSLVARDDSPPSPQPTQELASSPSPPPALSPRGAPQSFADLAEKSNPGVVFVRTVKSTRRGFQRVLGESSGSGFIFDPSGKILTNYHVVQGARAVQVELQDGRVLMANIIGADPLTDLAILQVEASGLPALPLGNSEKIRVGDWVLAIGNPFGLEHTVSAGIISAKERTVHDVNLGNPDAYYSFLQTDASINPGNSGGPLLDLQGQVVGINTAINQDANSIGFAIPIDMVKRLLPRLLKDGQIKRAAIGVKVSDVSAEAVRYLKLKTRQGALVLGVSEGGPAHKAGLLPGDVVVVFDGQAISSPDELRWNASLSTIGKEVSLTVIREGQKRVMPIRPAPLRIR